MKKYPIALVDCNNFYASCERIFNPKLEGKPIIVLSNNDGMIIARSNEAKAVGIKMGEPLFKVKELVDKYDVKVFSSNYTLYGDMSQRVMSLMERFSPKVEIYSIDEAFLSFDGFDDIKIEEHCRMIRKLVKKCTGIPVSIGIGSTKTLAKLANRVAKKNPEMNGVLNLWNYKNLDEYLKKVDVEDIWGVGRQYTKLLYLNNIYSAYDLKNAPDKWIRSKMSVMGLRTVFELREIPCVSIDSSHPDKKSIVCSRSFGRVTNSLQFVKEAIALFTSKAAEKMRKQNSAAHILHIFLRTNPFKSNPQYHNGVMVEFPIATDSTAEMLRMADKAVEQIFKPEYEYQKVGVMLSGFVRNDNSQTTIFDSENRIKNAKITELIDKLNKDWGANSIFYASAGTKREWKTKAEKRSPRYTTSWKELALVDAD